MPNEIQERYFDLLLGKVEELKYPSKEHMDRVEALLADREQIEDYAHALLDKIQCDRFPSVWMLDRVLRLSQLLD